MIKRKQVIKIVAKTILGILIVVVLKYLYANNIIQNNSDLFFWGIISILIILRVIELRKKWGKSKD